MQKTGERRKLSFIPVPNLMGNGGPPNGWSDFFGKVRDPEQSRTFPEQSRTIPEQSRTIPELCGGVGEPKWGLPQCSRNIAKISRRKPPDRIYWEERSENNKLHHINTRISKCCTIQGFLLYSHSELNRRNPSQFPCSPLLQYSLRIFQSPPHFP